MGTREAGFTSSLPGYRKFDNAADRAELAALWDIDESRFPTKRGLAYPDIIEARGRRRRSARCGSSRRTRWSRFPNQDVLRQALANLDFLVVQDGYHPTPTTELAHLVLPAAIWGEKEGTYTNSERRVSKVNKAVEPPGEARSDFDIFLAVAERLGMPRRVVPGLDTAARRLQRMAARVARTPVRLLRHQLRTAGRSTARCSGRFRRARREPRRASMPMASSRPPTAARKLDLRRVGAVPGAAERRLSVRAQHGPHRGALAHAHQDARGADSGAAVAATRGWR